MTIEERAEEFYQELVNHDSRGKDLATMTKHGYIQGATDQHRIDKEKFDVMLSSAHESFIKYFSDKAIKFMVKLGLFGCEDSIYAEQFKQAMKE